MARERGFVLEVTAFLSSETDIHSMSVAAHKLEQVTEALHGLGFSAVAVSSKFTSRKVEADPVPDLDDSKFATNSGAPQPSQGHQAAQAIQDQIIAPALNRLTAEEEAELDVPGGLLRVSKAQP